MFSLLPVMNAMYPIKSFTKVKFLFIVLALEGIKCTIDGSFSKPRQNNTKTGDDPCNPLYWYPRNIPEYCNFRKMVTPTPPGPDLPIPIPIPVPLPPPMPVLPPPVVPPLLMPPPVMPPGPPPPVMVPHPVMPLPMPLPFGIPLAPTNPMVPVAGIPLSPPIPLQPSPLYPIPYPPQYPQPYAPPYAPPYPSPIPAPIPAPMPAPYPHPYPPSYPSPYPMPQRRGIGMVPGIPGLVSPDGGINIMPFSDAYADMLENHKQKMLRKHLQKIINEYDGHPWKSRRKTRRHGGREDNDDKLDENTID